MPPRPQKRQKDKKKKKSAWGRRGEWCRGKKYSPDHAAFISLSAQMMPSLAPDVY